MNKKLLLAAMMFLGFSTSAMAVEPLNITDNDNITIYEDNIYNVPNEKQPSVFRDCGLYVEAKAQIAVQAINADQENDKSDTVFGGGLALGYDFSALNENCPLRVEIEYIANTKADLETGTTTVTPGGTHEVKTQKTFSDGSVKTIISTVKDPDVNNYTKDLASVQTSTLMANVYCDIKNKSGFNPYVMVGAGTAFNNVKYYDANQNKSSKTETKFAWQAGIGMTKKLTQHTTIDVGLRYVHWNKIHAVNTNFKNDQWVAQLGFRYNF